MLNGAENNPLSIKLKASSGALFLCLVAPENGKLKHGRQGHGKQRTNEIQPQIAQFFIACLVDVDGEIVDEENRNLTNDSAPEDGVAPDEFDVESDQENPKNGSVENRSDDVYELDEVFKERSDAGEQNRDDAPHNRKHLRRIYKMFL